MKMRMQMPRGQRDVMLDGAEGDAWMDELGRETRLDRDLLGWMHDEGGTDG